MLQLNLKEDKLREPGKVEEGKMFHKLHVCGMNRAVVFGLALMD